MPDKLTKAALALAVVALAAPLLAEERIDYQALARIRKEGRERSQILHTLHFLTDVHGPRLTGSPNHKAAAEWALKQMREWGLENAHLEPWEFGHTGWLNERFAGFIVSPVKNSLAGEVLAWTPSTNGAVRAGAVRIEPPRCVPASNAPALAPPVAGPPAPMPEICPKDEELTAYLDGVKDKVKGAIVLVGAHTKVQVNFNPPSLRRDEEQVRRQYDLDNPAPSPFANQPPRAPTEAERFAACRRETTAEGPLGQLSQSGWTERRPPYDVAADGERFLFAEHHEPGSAEGRLHVVVNWFEELRRRVPAR